MGTTQDTEMQSPRELSDGVYYKYLEWFKETDYKTRIGVWGELQKLRYELEESRNDT